MFLILSTAFLKINQLAAKMEMKEARQISIVVVPRPGNLTREQADFISNGQSKRWISFFEISLEEVNDIPLTSLGSRKFAVSELNR